MKRLLLLYSFYLLVPYSSIAQIFNTVYGKNAQPVLLKKPEAIQAAGSDSLSLEGLVFDSSPAFEAPQPAYPVGHGRSGIAEVVFINPIKGEIKVNSGFGERYHPILNRMKFHNGIDIRAKYVPVYAMSDCIILDCGYDGASGNYIRYHTYSGLDIVYCHLSEIYCSPGDIYKIGTVLGVSGNTGLSTGAHLHISSVWNGQPVDPMEILHHCISF